MKTVYLLESIRDPRQRYIGSTSDIERRLKEHNQGKSRHTSKHLPWRLVVSVQFEDNKKAEAFEEYLKHGSGHAFAKRHLW